MENDGDYVGLDVAKLKFVLLIRCEHAGGVLNRQQPMRQQQLFRVKLTDGETNSNMMTQQPLHHTFDSNHKSRCIFMFLTSVPLCYSLSPPRHVCRLLKSSLPQDLVSCQGRNMIHSSTNSVSPENHNTCASCSLNLTASV